MTSVAERLLRWFDRHKRDLPWRRTRDPWAVWVSEIMLQQTRVEVVREVYPRFMRAFPTPEALAGAEDDELLTAWKGLGYYRRARSLREAARKVVDEHRGRIPDHADTLRALPGIGEYTGGAVASIAFDRPEIAVDGNVERVVARHRALEGNIKRQPTARAIRERVAAWLDPARPGDFNQALMDLGATVCTPRAPRCTECPLSEDCRARDEGLTGDLPQTPSPPRWVDVVSRAALVCVSGGRVLGSRIPEGEINAGQVELPGAGMLTTVPTASKLREALEQRYGVPFRVAGVVTTVVHGITNHRIRLHVHEASCSHGPGPNLMAVRPDDPRIPWTTGARKAFAQAALFLAANERGKDESKG